MKEKTIFISGASTGIGRETALLFSAKNWNVIATMRNPEKADDDLRSGTTLIRMDVTDSGSIADAVTGAIARFGKIDVLVNNAGYGLYGIFEAIDESRTEKLFATNVFGLMNVVKEVLPHFRKEKSGTIVNISSIGGRLGFPLYSMYQASKFAVEGFTESLAYELAPLGIRLRLVEPGVIKTDFYSRSMDEVAYSGIADYEDIEARCAKYRKQTDNTGSTAITVAKVIHKAATSRGKRLRYHAGPDAGTLLFLKRLVPSAWLSRLLRKIILE
jgi:NAD(P)-dependent dehydrogenase (short-subunit alcohol dehydrogenase family)